MILRFLAFTFCFLISAFASAKLPGCSYTPLQINNRATAMVKNYHDQKLYMPDSMIKRNTLDVDISNDDGVVNVDQNIYVEGFWRPIKDDFYTLGPAPIIGVDLERDNNLVYVCAWRDGDPTHEKVIIYFLRGYGLRRTGVTNFFEEYVNGQYLKITPLHVDVVGVGRVFHEISKLFWKIPILKDLVGLPANVLSDLESDLVDGLANFSGVGVERVTFTTDAIELASGVDLNDPTKTRTHVTISLKDRKISFK